MNTNIEKVIQEMYEKIENITETRRLEINKKIKQLEQQEVNQKEIDITKGVLQLNLIEEIDNIKTQYVQDIYFKHRYNKTTEDISILLDLNPLYVTRNLRDLYIDSVDIIDSSALKDKVSSLRAIELSKKKFLYSEDELHALIKNRLKIVNEYKYVNIQDIYEKVNSKNKCSIEKIKSIIYKYISKKDKKDNFRKITDNEFNSIISEDTQLLKLDSIKEVLKDNLIYKKYRKAIKIEQNENEIKRLEEELDNILKKRNKSFDATIIKSANMINQKQLERVLKKLAHTKYRLELEENKKINLILYAISDEIKELNYSEDEFDIAVPIDFLNDKREIKENIKEDIYKYIIKNKDKHIEEEL